MNLKKHWENIYSTKPSENLGWYKSHLDNWLKWIKELALEPRAPLIDIGGRMSSLVDDLMNYGYQNISVLDISETALNNVQSRIGKNSARVNWIVADITSAELLPDYFELWHDRAVFHFLISAKDRYQYRKNLIKSLKTGGHVIIGIFSPEAPPTCSGLQVMRYTSDQLQAYYGNAFKLLNTHKELHHTPGGVEQMYLYCHFQKIS